MTSQSLHELRMKADQAEIDARHARAACDVENPSDREYAERQAFNAEQRAASARFTFLGAQADAGKVAL